MFFKKLRSGLLTGYILALLALLFTAGGTPAQETTWPSVISGVNQGKFVRSIGGLPRENLLLQVKNSADIVGESIIDQSGNGYDLTVVSGDTWETAVVNAPDVQALKDADTDNVWFTGLGVANNVTISALFDKASGGRQRVGSKALAIYSQPQAGGVLRKTTRYVDTPWLPKGAVLHVDFTAGHFYWDGAVKTLDDLSVSSNGGYYLDYGFGFTDTAVVALDFEHVQNTATGTVFSWTSGYSAGNRIEFKVNNGPLDRGLTCYIKPLSGGSADSQTLTLNSISGDIYTVGSGRHRVLVKLINETLVNFQPDNGSSRNGDKIVGTLSTPTRLGFGNRAWAPGDPDDPYTNGNLRSVTIYNTNPSDAQTNVIGQRGYTMPIHLLGDSFLNNYKIFAELMGLTKGLGYISYSQDGVGSSTITEQAARLASNNPKWHDSILVISDFGFDGTSADAITAIESMLSALGHNKWVYLEPAPAEDDGTAARDTWNAKVSDMRTYCGTHFVDTLSVALANGDDSTEDNAEIAKELWPLSLKTSLTDFHPSALGEQLIAEIIRDALSARGWL